MAPRYEYEFGVFVDADSEQEAWEKVRAVSEALDKIDAEGDSTVEGPIEVGVTHFNQWLEDQSPLPKEDDEQV